MKWPTPYFGISHLLKGICKVCFSQGHSLAFWEDPHFVYLPINLLLTYHFASRWIPSVLRHKEPELQWVLRLDVWFLIKKMVGLSPKVGFGWGWVPAHGFKHQSEDYSFIWTLLSSLLDKTLLFPFPLPSANAFFPKTNVMGTESLSRKV